MRSSKVRWFATLLMHPMSATKYIRENFPEARFFLTKRETKAGEMIRDVRFKIGETPILHARSVVDLNQTHPKIVKILRTTNKPLAEAIEGFHYRRTRMRSTTRTGEFHYLGDIRAKIWERFYPLPVPKKKKTKN